MRRKVFDVLVSTGGAVIVVVLVVAGALALWGHSVANSSVVQPARPAADLLLAEGGIRDHAKAGTEITPGMLPYLEQYAGQQLLTGPQAKAYADHFIAVHLSEMPYAGAFTRRSAGASMAKPNDAALAAEVQTVFRGTTLAGLALEAYGFSTLGVIVPCRWSPRSPPSSSPE